MQIEINNLVVTYKNNVALDLKNLTIPNGGAYGIVGHNGAGKTTLFKSLTNIITNYSGGDCFRRHVCLHESNRLV